MIYCVWYPSGGFGHFVNAILTLHGNNFIRPKKLLEFSTDGNSHNLDLVVPKYLHERWPGGIEFQHDKNYSILIDNGIDNESETFKSLFPNSTVIKLCYSDYSWPVIASTSIVKAMGSSIEKQLTLDHWAADEPWARREKYFLYLRDHTFRHAWKKVNSTSIDVATLYSTYQECYAALDSIVEIEDFYNLWSEWRNANAAYINPVLTANDVLLSVLSKSSKDLLHITDNWTQAIIYYYIWLRYNFEVPHNDYSNWFTNTLDIVKMLREHGVDIDSL